VTRYVLDTNVVVDFLSGKKSVVSALNESSKISISIITVVEYLANKNLSASQHQIFEKFLNTIHNIEIPSSPSSNFIQLCIKIRKNFKLKLPDAIIAASAIHSKSILVSRDAAFKKVKELKLLTLS